LRPSGHNSSSEVSVPDRTRRKLLNGITKLHYTLLVTSQKTALRNK